MLYKIFFFIKNQFDLIILFYLKKMCFTNKIKKQKKKIKNNKIYTKPNLEFTTDKSHYVMVVIIIFFRI